MRQSLGKGPDLNTRSSSREEGTREREEKEKEEERRHRSKWEGRDDRDGTEEQNKQASRNNQERGTSQIQIKLRKIETTDRSQRSKGKAVD